MTHQFHRLARGIVAAALLTTASSAFALTYSDNFATTSAIWASNFDGSPIHYFYFLGANVSQSYGSTGLAAADKLDLVYPFLQNSSEPLTFTLSLNSVDIGTWFVPSGSGSGTANLSYSFASIASVAGAFTIGLRVTTPVCGGCGNVELLDSDPGRFTLTQSVPEPASWALMIAGFGLVGGAMRSRSAVVA